MLEDDERDEDGTAGSDANDGAEDGDGERGDAEENQDGEETEAEVEARAAGWKPEGEWKGDPPPGGFVDADKYLERSHIVKTANEGLKGDLTALQARYDKLDSRQKAQDDWREKLDKQAHDRAVETVRGEQRAAAEDGDLEAYDKAKAKEADIKPPEKPETPKEEAPGITPAFKAWKAENAWYDDNQEMTEYADWQSNRIAQKNPNMPEAEFYKMVTDKVKAQFPEKSKPRSPEGGGQRPRSTNGKSWRDIPSDERKEIADAGFFDDGLYENTDKGRAEYAKDYFAQEQKT